MEQEFETPSNWRRLTPTVWFRSRRIYAPEKSGSDGPLQSCLLEGASRSAVCPFGGPVACVTEYESQMHKESQVHSLSVFSRSGKYLGSANLSSKRSVVAVFWLVIEKLTVFVIYESGHCSCYSVSTGKQLDLEVCEMPLGASAVSAGVTGVACWQGSRHTGRNTTGFVVSTGSGDFVHYGFWKGATPTMGSVFRPRYTLSVIEAGYKDTGASSVSKSGEGAAAAAADPACSPTCFALSVQRSRMPSAASKHALVVYVGTSNGCLAVIRSDEQGILKSCLGGANSDVFAKVDSSVVDITTSRSGAHVSVLAVSGVVSIFAAHDFSDFSSASDSSTYQSNNLVHPVCVSRIELNVASLICVGWMADDAVAVCLAQDPADISGTANRGSLVLVGGVSSEWCLVEYESTCQLCSEVDGLGIVTSDGSTDFFQKVSLAVESVYANKSTTEYSLVSAASANTRRAPQVGPVSTNQLPHLSIDRKLKVSTHSVLNLCEAAYLSTPMSAQTNSGEGGGKAPCLSSSQDRESSQARHILQGALLGQKLIEAPCDVSTNLVPATSLLRVCAAVNSSQVGLAISAYQIESIGAAFVVEYLCMRGMFDLAKAVALWFSTGSEHESLSSLVHERWSVELISKANATVSDVDLVRYVTAESPTVTRMWQIAAACARRLNRKELAVMLLQYESDILQRTNLYLQLDEPEKAVRVSLESGHSAAIRTCGHYIALQKMEARQVFPWLECGTSDAIMMLLSGIEEASLVSEFGRFMERLVNIYAASPGNKVPVSAGSLVSRKAVANVHSAIAAEAERDATEAGSCLRSAGNAYSSLIAFGDWRDALFKSMAQNVLAYSPVVLKGTSSLRNGIFRQVVAQHSSSVDKSSAENKSSTVDKNLLDNFCLSCRMDDVSTAYSRLAVLVASRTADEILSLCTQLAEVNSLPPKVVSRFLKHASRSLKELGNVDHAVSAVKLIPADIKRQQKLLTEFGMESLIPEIVAQRRNEREGLVGAALGFVGRFTSMGR